jgi:hypothetical protein
MFDWFMKRTKGDHKLEKKHTLDAGNLYYDQVLSGIPSIQTADPNNRITNVYAGNSWTSIGHLPGKTLSGIATDPAISNSTGRSILEELDELREAVLLLTRDLKLEKQYPELKQAYDDYMELYRSIKIADKLAKTGNNDET